MSVLVTVIFIICAYLVSMNNENIGDAISVLFGIFCFYTILFSYRVINQFASSLESPSLIYLLPLKKRDLYICHFIPTLGWVFLVAFLFTVLILTSGSSLESAGIFLLKSIAAGFIFLQGSFNYTLGSYPDIKKAKKQVIYWCVLLLILSAIFYVFAIIVVLFMVMVSLYQLKKIKFYKVS